MKGLGFIFLAVLALTHFSSAIPATSSYLKEADRVRLRQVIDSADLNDLPAAHYAVLGYKLLGAPVPKPQEVCKLLSTRASEPNVSGESLFHVTGAWQALGSCAGSLPTAVIGKRFNEIASSEVSTVPDLYHAVLGLKSLGQRPSDVGKLLKNLQALLKKDDSAVNLGYTFHIASTLGNEGRFAMDRIEDALVQADEVDSRFLQFEGGLSITALVLSGAYNLGTAQNSAPPLSLEQTTKFANYFLSRRSVQTAKGVYSLLDVLNVLTTNKFHIPVAMTLEGSSAVSVQNPKVNIKVSDLLGKALSTSPFTVTAESMTRIGDEVVVLSKKKFVATADKTLYSLNLLEDKPAPGQYKLAVTAALSKADPRIPSSVATSVVVKVMCSVSIPSFEIGIADADQTTQPKLNKVVYPSKLPSMLEADSQQKVMVRFQLNDAATNQPLTVHQAFLRLWNEQTGQEIIFNADRDNSKTYKFVMDVGAKDPDFGFLSGLFHVDLIIGDFIITNPLMWRVADLKLSTSAAESKEVKVPKTHADLYKPKPEIKHMFREPEKRPPAVVSNLFTSLVLIPLLVLFALWAKLGVNISNFPFSLTAVGFHAGLASIFGLFAVFWLKLNMFTTVKYLIGLGMVTFLCGNKMLAHIAKKRKAQ